MEKGQVTIFILVGIVLIVGIVLLFFVNRDVDVVSEEEVCLNSGGVWKEFSNGCVDSCSSQRRDDVLCTQALTFGCDCPGDFCWNGESCERI